MRAIVLLLLPAAAAIGSDSLPPRIPPHNLRRHLQKGAEFCYDCMWNEDTTCEARAQYLVREYGGITLEEARASILDDIRQGAVSKSDDCAVDGTAKEQVSLDLAAFCGECMWNGMNFDCNKRVVFLWENYAVLEEEAKAGLLEKGECVDPDYVAPSIIITEEAKEKDPQRLSNGAVIAIVVISLCITAVLLCLIWLLATRRHKREKVEENSQDTAVPIGSNDSPEAIDDEEPHTVEEPPEFEHVPAAAKKKKKRRKSKRRLSSDKTISFALAKPDPDGVTSYIYPETTIEEEFNTADAGVGLPDTKDPRKPPVSLLRKPRYSSKGQVEDQELLNDPSIENADMENCDARHNKLHRRNISSVSSHRTNRNTKPSPPNEKREHRNKREHPKNQTSTIMTTGFSTAATWLQNISGPNVNTDIAKKDEANDPILRDLRAMKDEETKDGVHSFAPPRHDSRGVDGRNVVTRGLNSKTQQPKPKFVAHKDPTRGKKGKDKASSNRLGNDLHMA